MRTRLAGILASGAAAVVLAATVLSAGTSSAGAASTTVTYQATVTISAPPASNFSGSSGGDGWAVAMTPTAVYNVFHHNSSDVIVACHLQADATSCAANYPKTVTDTLTGDNFTSSGQPGMYMDQSTQKLYVYTADAVTSTAGVVCIDTTSSADNPFCGFTPLSAPGDAPAQVGISPTSNPVLVGNNWYSFNHVAGTPTGTQDQMLCFNVISDAACPGQPYAVDFGAGTILTQEPAPSIAAISGDIIVPSTVNSVSTLACFDALTNTSCGGSFPVATVASYSEIAGAPFADLNASGAIIGFCLPFDTDPCYDLTGATIATPPNMTAAILANETWNGPGLTIGPRVYVANGPTNSVDCYDYSLGASCSGFPKALSNLSLLYTVNPDPQRATCIWVNSDNGTAQIQNFDAFTGGTCSAGPTRVLASSVVVPLDQCIPKTYTSLVVESPAPSTYSTGTVSFEDGDENALPIPTQTLDGNGNLNLTPLDLNTQIGLPQFLITLNNVGAPPNQVVVRLTWTGSQNPACLQPGTTVISSPSPSPSPGHSALGYRLQGHDGGVFDYGASQFMGSLPGVETMGLVGSPIEATANTFDNDGYWLASSSGGVFAYGEAPFLGSLANTRLNAPIVGIAGTSDQKGYWMAAADGGVFGFGDAPFMGSLGGQKLNAPIVGISATPDNGGYWLVASDGGVFAFGDAKFLGSMGGKHLNAPVVGMASTPSGKGYWLVAADGGIFTYGDAAFDGSMAGQKLNAPVVAMVATPTGDGYWLMASDGGVFALGSAPFFGSATNIHLNQAITSAST